MLFQARPEIPVTHDWVQATQRSAIRRGRVLRLGHVVHWGGTCTLSVAGRHRKTFDDGFDLDVRMMPDTGSGGPAHLRSLWP